MREITRWSRLYIKFNEMFIPDGPHGDRQRGKLMEPYLKSFGKNLKIGAQAFIFNPNGLVVGNDVYIGFNSYIGQGEVELEDEVLIGNFVSITASNHIAKNGSFRFGGFKSNPIKIKKGTWIGANVSIVAGVTVGEGCLIASGAVVTNDLNNGVIAGGIPAKKIGFVSEFIKKHTS